MPSSDVRDLVCEHAGHLGFVDGGVQRASIDPDGTAWQRERIDLAVVGNRETVRIAWAVRLGRQPPADRGDVRLDRSADVRRLHPQLTLRLAAQRNLIGNRNERQRADGQNGQRATGAASAQQESPPDDDGAGGRWRR